MGKKMNLEEKKLFQRMNNHDNVISILDLPAGYEGTLLYGYNCDRTTFHVYAKDEEIHAVTYDSDKSVIKHEHRGGLEVDQCYPNKRVYRQETQYFFAKLLKERGAEFSIVDSGANEENCIKYGEFLNRGLIV